MQQDPILFRVLAVLALFGASLFIGLFRKEPWAKTEFGRSLMTMAFGVWLFALIATLKQVFGTEYVGRDSVRIIAYILIDYAVYARCWTLWKLQRNKADPPPRRRSTDLP